MIDISNQVYTLVKNALEAFDPSIGTSSVYTNTPSKYPFVSVEEIENMVDSDTSDCELENHAIVQYEVNIYCKDPLKKSKAMEICQVVDELLSSYGFVRVSKNNIQDTNETIYRIITRYEAIVSKDKVIYRR